MISFIIFLILPMSTIAMELHEAVKQDRVTIVEELANAQNIHERDSDGATPLHHVRSKQVAEILIERSANVNAEDMYRHTPLHYLAYSYDGPYDEKKHNTIIFLLNRGAEVNFKNMHGYTPLSCSPWCVKPTALVQLLLEHGATISGQCNQKAGDLDHAVEHNCDEIVNLFIQKRGACRSWLNHNSQILLNCKNQDHSKIVKLFD